MVKGLEKFREFFKDYADNYVLIGGTACNEQLSEAGLGFRATKDLDIILVVEALTSEFVERFWEFVKDGGYEIKQKSEFERKYYRFRKPAEEEYPSQLELFARKPDLLDLDENSHLTPIPADEDLSSLSAILLDKDYYRFTIENSDIENDLHLASIETLICLKAKAYLDLRARKRAGETVDSKEIKKHKNDIVRLVLALTESNSVVLPEKILTDMKNFLELFEKEPPDFAQLAKTIGIRKIDKKKIIAQLRNTFSL